MLIDPRVIARLGAVLADALEARTRILVEAPALRAVIAGRLRPVQRTLALARDRSCRGGRWRATPTRRPSCRCRRRARRSRASARCRPRSASVSGGFDAGHDAHDGARVGRGTCPTPSRRPGSASPRRSRRRCACPSSDRPAGRARRSASRLPLPLVSRISAVQPCDFAASPVAVEHLRVQPADHRAAAARPQRVVGVVAELRMVRAEAGVDERVLLRLRIEHRELPGRLARPGTASPTDDPSPACRSRGFSGPRTAAASHTRPVRSNIELWLLTLVSQIALLAPVRRRLQRRRAPRHGPGPG